MCDSILLISIWSIKNHEKGNLSLGRFQVSFWIFTWHALSLLWNGLMILPFFTLTGTSFDNISPLKAIAFEESSDDI